MNSKSNDNMKYYIAGGVALVVIIILIIVSSTKSNGNKDLQDNDQSSSATSFIVETDMNCRGCGNKESDNWGGLYSATDNTSNGFPVYKNEHGHRIEYETGGIEHLSPEYRSTQSNVMKGQRGWVLIADGQYRVYLVDNTGDRIPLLNKQWILRDQGEWNGEMYDWGIGSSFKVIEHI